MTDQKKVQVHDGVNKAIIEFTEEMYLVDLIKWSIVQLLLKFELNLLVIDKFNTGF